MKWPTKRSALAIALALGCHFAGAGAVWRVGQRPASPRLAIPVSAVTSPKGAPVTDGAYRNRLARTVPTGSPGTQYPKTTQRVSDPPIDSVPPTPATTAPANTTPLLVKGIGAAQTEAPAQAGSPGPTSAELAEVRTRIERHVRYPLSLRRLGIEGIAQVSVHTSKSGGIEDIRISKSSGSADLDELALTAVREAAPLPTSRALTFILPIEFRTSESRER